MFATILKVAGAAATGITATGFIVLVGAVVFWIRFNEAGLPATQAISLLPRNELLAQGAQQTIVYLGIALAAILLLYFADPEGTLARVSVLLLAALTVLAIVYPFTTELQVGCSALLALVALALFAGCVVVGLRTGSRFWPLALAVFVATLAYTATVGLLVVKEQGFVQAMAVLRGDGDAGLVGVYVAVTDKSIYIGQVAQTPGEEEELKEEGSDAEEKRAIVEVPREGAVYAVGPLDSIADAKVRGDQMLEQLVSNRERAGAKPKAESGSGKTKEAESGPTGEAGPTGPTGATGQAGATASSTESSAPAPVVTVAEAFGSSIAVHRTVESPWDCLVRYGSAASEPIGHWWTSCSEDKAKLSRLSLADIRDSLALPVRFQPAADMRVEAVLPIGAELFYLEGGIAPQCEHDSEALCGYRYPGGGPKPDQDEGAMKQIYLPEPQQVTIKKRECTEARQDAPNPTWKLCFSN